MSTNNQTRTRSDRVAQLDLPPSRFEQAIEVIRRGDVLIRIGLCVFAAVVLWLVTRGWAPPFPYRVGSVPLRGVASRVGFERPDPEHTNQLREAAREKVECIYDHDVSKLVDRRAALREKVLQVGQSTSYEELEEGVRQEFLGAVLPGKDGQKAIEVTEEEKKRLFELYQSLLTSDENLDGFEAAVRRAFSEFEHMGLLESPQHELGDGRMTAIRIRRLIDGSYIDRVPIDDVRIAVVAPRLLKRLAAEERLAPVAPHLYAWIRPRLPVTLSFNRDETRVAAQKAADRVATVMHKHLIGDLLAPAGVPLDADTIGLLELEHEAYLATLKPRQQVVHTLACMGMYAALYTLCGCYMYFRRGDVLSDFRRFSKLLCLVVVTVATAWFAGRWHAEAVPLIIFAMVMAIAHQQELALLLSACVALVAAISLGQGLHEFVITTSSMASAALLLRHVRSRTRIIYVGLATGLVAMLTAAGMGTMVGWDVETALLSTSLWFGFCALLAGLLMTSLLPFVERIFDIQTEISLLELGDVAHPLLQELVRRAPGTYNHSINVASLAEAAADAIGANGLLVRVGAYFHDIGKMLKPAYFVENQAEAGSRHETLMPAMSTLVIIAHVKDGADLARQHHLPQSIIDFILQHHGTTLVEYFYHRASQQSELDPDKGEVDEGSYRYPGPKPQTKETAVLMIADAVESASRALVDPTPSRLENLVHEIARKRLLDGQFDECNLTLRELREIEDSLIKSLAAVYHGRIKYPEPQPARIAQ